MDEADGGMIRIGEGLAKDTGPPGLLGGAVIGEGGSCGERFKT